ncbi:hypothetical protein G6F66_015707 [Rhizopus arrhizus]|nr:hypothetical protein G6F66_015707 [Rhizopus arrhizus]
MPPGQARTHPPAASARCRPRTTAACRPAPRAGRTAAQECAPAMRCRRSAASWPASPAPGATGQDPGRTRRGWAG